MPFVPAVLRTASTHYISRVPGIAPSKNECYIPLSGGLRGQPFAQHCSCSIVLRCSVNLTMAAFWGTIHVYESCFLAQWLVSHRTRQQGGVVTPSESFAYQDKPGTLSPCGAERKTGSKTCATSSSQHFTMSPLRGDVMIYTRKKILWGERTAVLKNLQKVLIW